MRPWAGALLFFIACTTGEGINPLDAGVAETEVSDAGIDHSGHDTGPVPPTSGILVKGPLVLSQSGLYSDFAKRTITPGILEFTPRWPLWSDGAEKRRWIQLPQGKTIDSTDMNQWSFPVGTKFWKEFSVAAADGGKTIVETRLLWKQGDGWANWWMGSYVWRQDGSDADYVEQGQAGVLGTSHDAPSQVDCVRCHNSVIDVAIGFSSIQLSAPSNSQLSLYSAMGMLSKPATQEYDAPGSGTTKAALTDLHANCGHCHVETGWLYLKQTKLVFRLRTTDLVPQDTGAYAAIGMKAKHEHPTYGTYNIYPQRPDLSQAWLRASVRDNGIWQMPPVCTKILDTVTVKDVGEWITSLPPGQDL